MNKYYRNFLTNTRLIKKAYQKIFLMPKKDLGVIEESLLKNYSLLIQYKNQFLKKRVVFDLIYQYIYKLLNKNHFNINFSILKEKLNLYQDQFGYFSYVEISSIPTTIFYCLIARLSDSYRVHKKRIDDDYIISNIFSLCRSFYQFSEEDFIQGISRCEKLLNQDKDYQKMSVSTKKLYRKKISFLSRKKGVPEYKLIERKEGYIGDLLFKNKVGEAFSMDYSHGISKSSSTLLVLESLVNSIQDVEYLYQKLESIYLTNQSQHLYFILLTNSILSSEIVKEIKNYSKKLNRRYKEVIFLFAIRKDISFYQLKTELIHYLVGKKYYFDEHNLDQLKRAISYLVTIDKNTNIIPNQLLSLIGIISHPLNRKEINHKKNIYGINKKDFLWIKDSSSFSKFCLLSIGQVSSYDDYLTYPFLKTLNYCHIRNNFFYSDQEKPKILNKNRQLLSLTEEKNMKKISNKMWKYFEDSMNSNSIASLYSDEKKSFFLEVGPIDIGVYFLSVISAYELALISIDCVVNYFNQLFRFINQLDKWNHHLYKKYNALTKKVLDDQFISSIDSCVFVYSLLIVKGFLMDKNEKKLINLCDFLIQSVDFSCFFVDHQFSKGFYCYDLALSDEVYSIDSSEHYLLNYLSICKGDIDCNFNFPKKLSYSKFTDLCSLFLLDSSLSYPKKFPFFDYDLLASYPCFSLLYFAPSRAYKMIEQLKKKNMAYKYGFYDYYDCHQSILSKNSSTYYQCLNLMNIVKYQKSNIFKQYLFLTPSIRAYSYLLRKSISLDFDRFSLSSSKTLSCKDCYILSNRNYSVLYYSNGSMFSRYKYVFENRFTPYHNYLYIKDLKSNEVVSTTYYPVCNPNFLYSHFFEHNEVVFTASSPDLSIKSNIIVLDNCNLEVKKVTIINKSSHRKSVELTSYLDLFDYHHLSFSFNPSLNMLIAKNEKNVSEVTSYRFNQFICDFHIQPTYEVDRDLFLRDSSIRYPLSLDRKLSNTINYQYSCVMSLRIKINIKSNDQKTVYFLNGFGRSQKQLEGLNRSYSCVNQIEKAISLNQFYCKNNSLYNEVIKYIYFMSVFYPSKKKSSKNKLYLLSLKDKIEKKLPIILIRLSKKEDLSFLDEFLSFYQYSQKHLINFTVILVNDLGLSLHSYKKNYSFLIIFDGKILSKEEKVLLKNISNLIFNPNGNHFKDEIFKLSKQFTYQLDDSLKIMYQPIHKQIDTVEYTYNKLTKNMNNILSNNNLYSYVNDYGYSYTSFNHCYLTSYLISNHSSEEIRMNDCKLIYNQIEQKKGYSVLKGSCDFIQFSITEFIAREENVKVFLLKLTNQLSKKRKISLSFHIFPILSEDSEDYQYIVSQNHSSYLNLQNPYSKYHSLNLFLSSNLKINQTNINYIASKSIYTQVMINRSVEMVFLLGCSKSDEKSIKLISKYSNLIEVKHELNAIKKQ